MRHLVNMIIRPTPGTGHGQSANKGGYCAAFSRVNFDSLKLDFEVMQLRLCGYRF